MESHPDAKLLRIFIGESDRGTHGPLYETIVREAKQHGLAGATVIRAIMGFGANSAIHSLKLFDLSSDLPIVIEIVDTDEKIRSFVPIVDTLLEAASGGGLVTIEKAEVLLYRSGR